METQNSKLHVLVKESDPFVRQCITTALEKCGFVVLETSDVLEAILITAQSEHSFALLVCDFNLTESANVRFIEHIRGQNRDLKIIFAVDSEDCSFPRAVGRNMNYAVLRKPFSTADLLHVVESLLVVACSGRPTDRYE